MRKKIEACFAAFITGADDEETLGSAATDADGRRVESFEPGTIEYLAPGKDVKFATPSHAGGYGEYMRVQLHAIAAGVGLTYELLPAIQPGQLLVDPRRIAGIPQADGGAAVAAAGAWAVPAGLAAVRRHCAGDRRAADGDDGGGTDGAAVEAVDPLKDIQADILAVRGGLMTLKEAIARQGTTRRTCWPRSAPPMPSSMRSASCSTPIRARRPRPAPPSRGREPEHGQRLSAANRSGGSASDAGHGR